MPLSSSQLGTARAVPSIAKAAGEPAPRRGGRSAPITRRVAILLPLLLAAAPAGLRPGLWQVYSAPTGATLDGKPLRDLPYNSQAGPRAICVGADEARDIGWLTRDFAPGCAVTRRSLAGGRVGIDATCPPQAPGLARGAVHLAGTWSPGRYALRFATTNPSENGVMGFTGTMTGRRVGGCPPTVIPVNPAPRP